MLVLTRKVGEKIHIGEGVVVTVVRVVGDKVRIGIDAPRDVRVHRQEVALRLARAAAEPLAGDISACPPGAPAGRLD